MVKKQKGRDINPADAYRKAQRAKEIDRNKKERKFLRDATKLKSDPEVLKKELTEMIELEEEGKTSQTLRLKRQAVQRAYDAALRKKREDELAAKGLLPAPGGAIAGSAGLPLPQPPPLPSGPAPTPLNIPVPDAPAAPILPPPLGPPPGLAGAPLLPPPAYPPPGMAAPLLPPPAYPPPGMATLPPPSMPPPGLAAAAATGAPGGAPAGAPVLLPPPPGAPPGVTQAAATTGPKREVKATIAGASTAVKRPLAQNDKTVTSMVPASVRIRREQGAEKAAAAAKKPVVHRASAGFGLMPTIGPARLPPEPAANVSKGGVDTKYMEFLSAMGELGAFEG